MKTRKYCEKPIEALNRMLLTACQPVRITEKLILLTCFQPSGSNQLHSLHWRASRQWHLISTA